MSSVVFGAGSPSEASEANPLLSFFGSYAGAASLCMFAIHNYPKIEKAASIIYTAGSGVASGLRWLGGKFSSSRRGKPSTDNRRAEIPRPVVVQLVDVVAIEQPRPLLGRSVEQIKADFQRKKIHFLPGNESEAALCVDIIAHHLMTFLSPEKRLQLGTTNKAVRDCVMDLHLVNACTANGVSIKVPLRSFSETARKTHFRCACCEFNEVSIQFCARQTELVRVFGSRNSDLARRRVRFVCSTCHEKWCTILHLYARHLPHSGDFYSSPLCSHQSNLRKKAFNEARKSFDKRWSKLTNGAVNKQIADRLLTRYPEVLNLEEEIETRDQAETVTARVGPAKSRGVKRKRDVNMDMLPGKPNKKNAKKD